MTHDQAFEAVKTSSEHVWTIAVGQESTTAACDASGSAGAPVFVCAHGAGGSMDDRAVRAIGADLAARGVTVVRFNFLYRARRSGRPDPMPKLIDCFDAVLARVRQELNPASLVIGGRSMGGRAASMLAARGVDARGLLLFAYPLHPPGQPGKLRSAHLPDIRMPVLCFNGTRDPFCDPALMEQVLGTVGDNWRMRWVEGADHSFHVLKSSGTTDAAVHVSMMDDAAAWMAEA